MRRDVGIQVKASDYAPAAITAEMRHGGMLRPSISLLARKRGAYVIASAGANCSEAMLQRRLDAMRNAATDDTNGADLDLVFLDRRAISRWVSAHPSVATLGYASAWHYLPSEDGKPTAVGHQHPPACPMI
jgi:hypothetical protein